MLAHIEESDVLMAEFPVPPDWQMAKRGKVNNTHVQAWCGSDRKYYVLMVDKDLERHVIMFMSANVSQSVAFWQELVASLGYTQEQQAEEALKMLKAIMREMGDYPPYDPDSDN